MIRANARLLALVLPFGMAACAASGGYPSLAVRDVERSGGSATPAAGDGGSQAPVLPPASADLVTRLNGLVEAAEEADRQFQSQRPVATRAVAAAGATGTDSWSAASVALARLESSHSFAMTALADLDTMYADARDRSPVDQSPELTAIADARAKVSALADAQATVLSDLSTRLRT